VFDDETINGKVNRRHRGGKRITMMVMMFVGGVVLLFDGLLALFLL
jgi:hypothetical protein